MSSLCTRLVNDSGRANVSVVVYVSDGCRLLNNERRAAANVGEDVTSHLVTDAEVAGRTRHSACSDRRKTGSSRQWRAGEGTEEHDLF